VIHSKFLFPQESTSECKLDETQQALPTDSKCEIFAAMNDKIVSEIKEFIADAELPGALSMNNQ